MFANTFSSKRETRERLNSKCKLAITLSDFQSSSCPSPMVFRKFVSLIATRPSILSSVMIATVLLSPNSSISKADFSDKKSLYTYRRSIQMGFQLHPESSNRILVIDRMRWVKDDILTIPNYYSMISQVRALLKRI